MKYVLALLGLLLAAVWALAGPPDAVVRIPSHGGSGTVIATGQGWTLILTAAHMFQGSDALKKIRVDAPAPTGGQPPQAVGIRLLGVDAAADLALIRLGAGPLPFVAPIAPPQYRPTVGKQLLSVGYDAGFLDAVIEPATVIQSVRPDRTTTAEKPWHGRSGGALLDGPYLVGVVSAYSVPPGDFGKHTRAQVLGDPRRHGDYAGYDQIVSFVQRCTAQTPAPARPPIVQGGYFGPLSLQQPCPGGICPPAGH